MLRSYRNKRRHDYEDEDSDGDDHQHQDGESTRPVTRQASANIIRNDSPPPARVHRRPIRRRRPLPRTVRVAFLRQTQPPARERKPHSKRRGSPVPMTCPDPNCNRVFWTYSVLSRRVSCPLCNIDFYWCEDCAQASMLIPAWVFCRQRRVIRPDDPLKTATMHVTLAEPFLYFEESHNKSLSELVNKSAKECPLGYTKEVLYRGGDTMNVIFAANDTTRAFIQSAIKRPLAAHEVPHLRVEMWASQIQRAMLSFSTRGARWGGDVDTPLKRLVRGQRLLATRKYGCPDPSLTIPPEDPTRRTCRAINVVHCAHCGVVGNLNRRTQTPLSVSVAEREEDSDEESLEEQDHLYE